MMTGDKLRSSGFHGYFGCIAQSASRQDDRSASRSPKLFRSATQRTNRRFTPFYLKIKICKLPGQIMGQYERLVLMAEDELTQYSTAARKIEKLRQKIGLSVSRREQEEVKAALLADMPTDPISKLLETQRQTVALPFWGIAGLGLLLGISFTQPVDFIATIVGTTIAIAVQRRGWSLQAKRLVLNTLEDIETRMKNPEP
jgi:hypothetical protein